MWELKLKLEKEQRLWLLHWLSNNFYLSAFSYKSFFIYVYCDYFLPVCDLLFCFLNGVFWRAVLILMNPVYQFFLLWFVLDCVFQEILPACWITPVPLSKSVGHVSVNLDDPFYVIYLCVDLYISTSLFLSLWLKSVWKLHTVNSAAFSRLVWLDISCFPFPYKFYI